MPMDPFPVIPAIPAIPPIPPIPPIPTIPPIPSFAETLADPPPSNHREGTDIDYTAVIIVIGALLVCVALPIVLHYRTKHRALHGPSPGEQAQLQEMWDAARRMEQRIGYLERVLDTEAPGWRSRSEAI